MAKDIEMVRKQASKDDFTCMCAPDIVSNIRTRNHNEEEWNCIILGWRKYNFSNEGKEYLQRKNELVGESLDAEGENRHQGYTSWYVEEGFLLISIPNSEQ